LFDSESVVAKRLDPHRSTLTDPNLIATRLYKVDRATRTRLSEWVVDEEERRKGGRPLSRGFWNGHGLSSLGLALNPVLNASELEVQSLLARESIARRLSPFAQARPIAVPFDWRCADAGQSVAHPHDQGQQEKQQTHHEGYCHISQHNSNCSSSSCTVATTNSRNRSGYLKHISHWSTTVATGDAIEQPSLGTIGIIAPIAMVE
jgi:hypothetical protein